MALLGSVPAAWSWRRTDAKGPLVFVALFVGFMVATYWFSLAWVGAAIVGGVLVWRARCAAGVVADLVDDVVDGAGADVPQLGRDGRDADEPASARGLLWDLMCFLPRTAHPFAPPCHAERAVPEITDRTREFLHESPSGNRVVLSAHSLGAVPAVAALYALPEGYLGRVKLLTYGVSSPDCSVLLCWLPPVCGLPRSVQRPRLS